MAAARNASPALPKDDSWITTTIVLGVVGVVSIVLTGTYWVQKTQAEAAMLRQQERVYQQYRAHTEAPAQPVELPASFVQAQQIRNTLLNHPAVKPGPGFDAPGVQATGMAIIEAIDGSRSTAAAPSATAHP